MINKLNAFSALARVMLSGAVVALLVMAAPSAVMADYTPPDGYYAYNTKYTLIIQPGITNVSFQCKTSGYSAQVHTCFSPTQYGNCETEPAYAGTCPNDYIYANLSSVNVTNVTGLHYLKFYINEADVTDIVNVSMINEPAPQTPTPTPTPTITGDFDAANVFGVAGDVVTLFGPVIAILAGIGLGFVLYAYLLRYLRSR